MPARWGLRAEAPSGRRRSGRSRPFRAVDEAPFRAAASGVVEAGGGDAECRRACARVIDRLPLVPLVGTAVAVGVVGAAYQLAVLVELGAVELAVAFGGNLDALQHALTGSVAALVERLRVHHAVVLRREADLFELAVRPVEVPALNLAVLVEVELHAEDPGPVHVADGVVFPIVVGVELEAAQAAGLRVVVGLGPGALRRTRAGGGHDQEQDGGPSGSGPRCGPRSDLQRVCSEVQCCQRFHASVASPRDLRTAFFSGRADASAESTWGDSAGGPCAIQLPG
jgi:hypothetical protein